MSSFAQVEEQLKSVSAELSAKNTKLLKLNEHIDSLENTAKSSDEILKSVSNELAIKNTKILKLNEHIDSLENAAKSSKKDLKKALNSLEIVNKKCAALTNQNLKLDQSIANHETHQETLRSTVVSLNEIVTSLTTRNQKLEIEIKTHEQINKDIMSQQFDTQTEPSILPAESANPSQCNFAQHAQLTAKLNEKNKEIKSLKDRVDNLETIIRDEEKKSSQYQVELNASKLDLSREKQINNVLLKFDVTCPPSFTSPNVTSSPNSTPALPCHPLLSTCQVRLAALLHLPSLLTYLPLLPSQPSVPYPTRYAPPHSSMALVHATILGANSSIILISSKFARAYVSANSSMKVRVVVAQIVHSPTRFPLPVGRTRQSLMRLMPKFKRQELREDHRANLHPVSTPKVVHLTVSYPDTILLLCTTFTLLPRLLSSQVAPFHHLADFCPHSTGSLALLLHPLPAILLTCGPHRRHTVLQFSQQVPVLSTRTRATVIYHLLRH